jgi:hypothetical protein
VKAGWLSQRAPGDGAVLLREFPTKIVRIACLRCDRAGQYRLAGLVERFGPAAGLPDVLWTLSADCPRLGVGQFGDPCGAHYPDLNRPRSG